MVNLILRLILDPDYKKRAPIPLGPGDFQIPFLSDDELKMVNSFKAQKKQIEWLCGRFSLKTLVREFCCKDTALFDIRISYHKKGAPFLNLYPDLPISLSHSGDFTAAAICPGSRINLGIDIEKIGKIPEAFFMKTAFTQKEISHMPPIAHGIYRNWTLKEAFLKYIKMGFNESLHQVEIIDNKLFYHGRQQELSFWSTTIENRYVLSMVADPF